MLTFRSLRHPGDATPLAVRRRAFAARIVPFVLALVVLGTMGALLQRPIAPLVGLGSVLSAVAAWYLAGLDLARRAVEIRVVGPQGAVRTALDVADDRPPRYAPVVDVRRGASVSTLTLGDEVWELDEGEWPALPELAAALGAARRAVEAPAPLVAAHPPAPFVPPLA